MSAALVILLYAVGLTARVFATATGVSGRAALSWTLTGLAVATWLVGTAVGLLSSSRAGTPSCRLGLVVVLLCLVAIVGSLVWRVSDSPRFRDLSTAEWALVLLRSLAPLVGFALGVVLVVLVA
jgi:hypothetical protein